MVQERKVGLKKRFKKKSELRKEVGLKKRKEKKKPLYKYNNKYKY